MNLTREQTIEEHRKMWNWIADETERLKRKVLKNEYFMHMGIKEWPKDNCYCCEYALEKDDGLGCKNSCPIQWVSIVNEDDYKPCCCYKSSPYKKWFFSKTYDDAVKYAREIANLPERSV